MVDGITTTLNCAHGLGRLCFNREIMIVNLIPFDSCNNTINDSLATRGVVEDAFLYQEFRSILASYDVLCFLVVPKREQKITSVRINSSTIIQSSLISTCPEEGGEIYNNNQMKTSPIHENSARGNNNNISEDSNKVVLLPALMTTVNENRIWEFIRFAERLSMHKRTRLKKHDWKNCRSQHCEEVWEQSSHSSESTGQRHSSVYDHYSSMKVESSEDKKESSTFATLMRIADDDYNNTVKDYKRRDICTFLDKIKLESSRKRHRANQLAKNNIKTTTTSTKSHHQPPLIEKNKDSKVVIGRESLDTFLTNSLSWGKPRQITVTTIDSDSSLTSPCSLSSFSSSSFDEEGYLSC